MGSRPFSPRSVNGSRGAKASSAGSSVMTRKYLFLGEYKYWTMTDCLEINIRTDDYVLNRALLYRDRRDFVVQPGDTGSQGG